MAFREKRYNGYLTVRDLAEKLNVSRSWIYKRLMSNEIPNVRIGGMVRFDEGEIAKWIKERKHYLNSQKLSTGGTHGQLEASDCNG